MHLVSNPTRTAWSGRPRSPASRSTTPQADHLGQHPRRRRRAARPGRRAGPDGAERDRISAWYPVVAATAAPPTRHRPALRRPRLRAAAARHRRPGVRGGRDRCRAGTRPLRGVAPAARAAAAIAAAAVPEYAAGRLGRPPTAPTTRPAGPATDRPQSIMHVTQGSYAGHDQLVPEPVGRGSARTTWSSRATARSPRWCARGTRPTTPVLGLQPYGRSASSTRGTWTTLRGSPTRCTGRRPR